MIILLILDTYNFILITKSFLCIPSRINSKHANAKKGNVISNLSKNYCLQFLGYKYILIHSLKRELIQSVLKDLY